MHFASAPRPIPGPAGRHRDDVANLDLARDNV